MNLLSIKSLSIRIGDITVCSELDMDIEHGQYWGILGSNGIGKTTLLHTLAGLRRPNHGEILLQQQDIEKYKRRNLAKKIGVLFQDSADTFPVSVLETAMTGRYPYLPFWSIEGKTDYEIVYQVLSLLALEDMAGRAVNTLSGGERRRLAIATLMIQNPLLWLLDEPTNHLDLHHQIKLLDLLADRVRLVNGSLIMVLHDVNLVTRFCTHVMLMLGSDQILFGPVAEIITRDNLQQLYRHPIQEFQSGSTRFFYPQ
jgi:iron complex transport system ATP-binding protein